MGSFAVGQSCLTKTAQYDVGFTVDDLQLRLADLEAAIFRLEDGVHDLRLKLEAMAMDNYQLPETVGFNTIYRLVGEFNRSCDQARQEVTAYRLDIDAITWSYQEMSDRYDNINNEIIKFSHWTGIVQSITGDVTGFINRCQND